jgi:hypothetical protein
LVVVVVMYTYPPQMHTYVCNTYKILLGFCECVVTYFVYSLWLLCNFHGVNHTPVFNMWFEYPELLLLFLIACICSLYLVLNVRPVCPIYFNGQTGRTFKTELSSLARKLGLWVRIPLRTWMFGVCMRLFCVRVVLCLGRGLATG